MRAVVVGGIAWNRMIHVDRFPEPRPATVFPERTLDAVGSSGAGKAMNFASLGWDVTFWTAVGEDDAGDRAVAAVEAFGVEVIRHRDPAGTAEHVNLMEPSGERISIHARTGTPDLAIPVGEVIPLFDGADVIAVTQYEYCRPLLATAASAGAPLLIDIHDYDGINPYHCDFIEAADWLFMSSVGMPRWRTFMEERAGAGTEIVVATHGSAGATGRVAGEFHDVEATAVAEVVDTNGAGDAFAAGFVDGWLNTADPATAMRRGADHAARAVASVQLAPTR